MNSDSLKFKLFYLHSISFNEFTDEIFEDLFLKIFEAMFICNFSEFNELPSELSSFLKII